jgi:hypothetical protein
MLSPRSEFDREVNLLLVRPSHATRGQTRFWDLTYISHGLQIGMQITAPCKCAIISISMRPWSVKRTHNDLKAGLQHTQRWYIMIFL